MLIEFLNKLINLDHCFAVFKINDIDKETREAIVAFCNETEFNSSIKEAILPLSGQFKDCIKYLEDIYNSKITIGGYGQCRLIAEKSRDFAEINPKAATLIALATLAAWESALGKDLYFQPYQGYHPGWDFFPLIVAHNAIKAGAMRAPKDLLLQASEFIAAAKMAPFDPNIKYTLKEYRKLLATIERDYSNHVANLTWCLRESCKSNKSPNFRPEIAALLWTLGYVTQAHLMKANDGDDNFTPSFKFLQVIVDYCMQTMHENILMQYIWLEIKDRQAFNLREHYELFILINTRFHTKPIHQHEEFAPLSPSASYAKVLINYFSGSKIENSDLTGCIATYADMLINIDTLTALQMRALLNLTIIMEEEKEQNWEYLSNLAIDLLTMHNRRGDFKNIGRCLDIPFYYLKTDYLKNIKSKSLFMEYYRCAGIWYWLLVTPQVFSGDKPKLNSMLKNEESLLEELRGAYFIRMLAFLPLHYRRYGVNLNEALHMGSPSGSTKREGLLQFDPFDQNLAKKELKETIDRLFELYKQMRQVSSEYASIRENPVVGVDNFIVSLNKHKCLETS